MFKYTPLYANGKEPIIEEQDVYRIEIPYVPILQGSDVDTTQKTTQKTTQRILEQMKANPYVSREELAEMKQIPGTCFTLQYHRTYRVTQPCHYSIYEAPFVITVRDGYQSLMF